jgi:16S rRNA (guanine966-N2)-methyltransferase
MRVIAGDCKGRRLKAVPGQNTRPTTDKVKESMFNIIGPYFEGGVALDLFAGTGGLGIEALSRGIDRAIFIDQDFKAISVIRDNVRDLRLEERTEIYKNDARRALDLLANRGVRLDLVFLDPPYHNVGLYEDVILKMQALQLLNPKAIIVAEHSRDVMLPGAYDRAMRWREATYGDISLSFYELVCEEEKGTEQ